MSDKKLYPTINDIFNEIMTGVAGGTHTTGNSLA